ncbi:MAG: hypothetical protein NZ843_01605, partial [Fimbriimonadales bacterium]|nr:hypothetical protein [Fimbriimonadales bacterium]
ELVETSRQSVARIEALERITAELVETSRQSVARIEALERITAELVETSRQSVARIEALERITAELVETSRQSVARIEALERITAELVETSRQSVARIEALERITAELVEISRQSLERLDALERRSERMEQGIDELQSWRRGEEGRRGGERYQLSIRRQAWQLLAGGMGGFPEEPQVEQRLREWLPPKPEDGFIEEEINPALADLIWWKADRVAVIEISLKVNGRDVQRARARADVLRRAGVNATPMVIGSEWAHPDSRRLAEEEQVEWKVGDDLSPGFIDFRKLQPQA